MNSYIILPESRASFENIFLLLDLEAVLFHYHRLSVIDKDKGYIHRAKKRLTFPSVPGARYPTAFGLFLTLADIIPAISVLP